MHRMLTDLREFDQRGGWHRQGAISCTHWLARRVGWSLVTARDHVRVANKLADFSLIDDALRRGEVSYSAETSLAAQLMRISFADACMGVGIGSCVSAETLCEVDSGFERDSGLELMVDSGERTSWVAARVSVVQMRSASSG